MLFLTFQIGNDRYALDSASVVEVLPLVNYKVVPGAAAGISGVFSYHGVPVPVIDLTELTLGRPAESRMSTRILVVKHALASGGSLTIGLKAEHATETIRRTDQDFVDPSVDGSKTYLGRVAVEGAQIIQRVEIARLLTEEVLAQLSVAVKATTDGTREL